MFIGRLKQLNYECKTEEYHNYTTYPTFPISTSHVISSDRPVMNDPNPGNPLTKKQVFPPYFG